MKLLEKTQKENLLGVPEWVRQRKGTHYKFLEFFTAYNLIIAYSFKNHMFAWVKPEGTECYYVFRLHNGHTENSKT